jgi:hypothetical protein
MDLLMYKANRLSDNKVQFVSDRKKQVVSIFFLLMPMPLTEDESDDTENSFKEKTESIFLQLPACH